MSFNGSGTFLINSSGQPVVTGTTISSTVFNALTADLATGLTNAICKDGQSTTTGTIPFATAVTMASTLGVTGATTLSSTLAVTGATTLSAALTYGGVTLSNSVTGTGSMMLSASPTTTGTLTAAAINASGAVALASTLTASPGGSSYFSASFGRVYVAGNSSTVALALGYNKTRTDAAQTIFMGATDSATPDFYLANSAATTLLSATSAGAVTIPGTLGVTGATSITGGSLTVGGNAVATTTVIANAAGGAAQGGYFAVQSAGTYKSIFGPLSAVTGSGTDQSLAVQSYSDNVVINAATAGKSVLLQVASANVATFTTGAATLPGTLGVTGAITASNLTASRAVLTDGSKNLISADAPVTNSLGADVTLNNIANYFDGPSCANGTTGTFFVSGTVTLTATAATSVYLKLWDGATVIASCSVAVGTGSSTTCATLSGYLTTPAGNLRISARDPSRTDTKIVFNATGNSKDSTISAVRVA